jgi:hypothetical protein
MTRRIAITMTVLLALTLPAVYAKESQPKPYQDATVLRVEKHEDQARVGGDNPSDAPLPDPETFSYDISVRVSCGTYVGRYQSWYDYVPSVFTANRKIQLRLTRSAMYVPVPNQKEVEMPIVSKHVERGPCNTTSTSAKR